MVGMCVRACVRACVHSCGSACVRESEHACVCVTASGGRGRERGWDGLVQTVRCGEDNERKGDERRERRHPDRRHPADVQRRRRPTDEKGARIVTTDGVTHVDTKSTPCECPRVPLAHRIDGRHDPCEYSEYHM